MEVLPCRQIVEAAKAEQLNLGTPECYFVPVLCLPRSLGTFDGVFVPKFSFFCSDSLIWARLRPVLFPFRVFTAVWAQKGLGLFPFWDFGY